MNHFKRGALATAIVLAFATGSAHAVLERVGPINKAPEAGNYPAWYQDKTGLTLEFCAPNQAELDGGYCLLLPGDTTVPEVFPTTFFDEHFYYAADAIIPDPGNGASALLVLALEAAFNAEVVDGGQIVFSRIRVRLNSVPMTGNYRFIHPYGEEILPGIQGERIFFTDDVGITCPQGQYHCAMDSRLGPFLLPSDTPGGAEQGAHAANGKLYIADPTRSGPVTGSTLPDFVDSSGATRSHNIFRIEGPVGSNLGGPGIDFIETTDFSLVGRLHQGSLAGSSEIKRVDWASKTGVSKQLDVFATATPTVVARLPGQPVVDPIAPALSFFPAPCAGVDPVTGDVVGVLGAPGNAPELQLFSLGSSYWGQAQPAAKPTTICVKDGSARNADGQTVPTYAPRKVSDTVVVTSAVYDPVAKALSVTATSSDEEGAPELKVAFEGFGPAPMAAGALGVTDLPVPPARVRVYSAGGGAGDLPVTVGLAPVVEQVGPVAMNDTFSVAEDAAPTAFAVLANDKNVAGAVVNITAQPALGTVVANADGTVTYTPKPNLNGSDSFSYTVTSGTKTSSPAAVAVAVTPVNDVPVAVNEAANGRAGGTSVIDVAANDIDADGNADIVGVADLTQPVGNGGQLGATVTASGRVVSFRATTAGTYTFTYKPVDSAGAKSANDATVTVNVIDAEAVNVTRAEYISRTRRLRVEGNITPAINQKVALTFENAAGTQVDTIVLEATSDATGAYAYDLLGFTLPAGTAQVRVTSLDGAASSSRTIRFK